ncbi:MAG: hypothetical protein H0X40_06555 [Chthoniobacterales bacterium]|nr:hypothetical protein [Chthoniobacterales bacterium]
MKYQRSGPNLIQRLTLLRLPGNLPLIGFPHSRRHHVIAVTIPKYSGYDQAGRVRLD